MTDNQDIRWKQRFQNFEKAFLLLQETMAIENPSIAERSGLIQFFEVSFELAWKLLKDYQEEEGFTISSPRDSIKQAFQSNLITDGHDWIEALKDRNLTTHTYDESTANTVDVNIRNKYYPLLKNLYNDFKQKLDK